ncbi:MAG: carboxypeptidase regulatory-like domain-containing protein [Candidatus Zixiibacteriota bacterium]
METMGKRGKDFIKVLLMMLIICLAFYYARCGLCSEEFNSNTEVSDEMEAPMPLIDDYEEIEAKIREMSEDLSYKNRQVAREAEGNVKNPGTIVGKVKVETIHSDISERHSEETIVYLEYVPGIFQSSEKRHSITTGNLAFTKRRGLPAEPPILDQWNVEFIPHVLPILKGSTVDFPNTDSVRHNVYSPVPIPGTHRMLSLGTYDPDVIKIIRLDKPGEIALRCNVHKEMSAFIVVLDNPYFTLTDKTGEFMLDNVPPGNYTLKTWHEKYKPVSQQVTVKPNQTVKVVLPTISERREAEEKRR